MVMEAMGLRRLDTDKVRGRGWRPFALKAYGTSAR